MFPLKNTEAYIHANGFRSTLGKELADRDAEISELGSEIQALTNYVGDSGVKNVLPVIVTTQEKTGITFTVNADGSITVDGTATADTYLNVYSATNLSEILENGHTYILSGCPSGYTSADGSLYINGSPNIASVDGSESAFTYNSSVTRTNVTILVKNGRTISNKTFYPMIRESVITDPTYAPYAKTNLELTQESEYHKGNTIAFTSQVNAFPCIYTSGKKIRAYVKLDKPIGDDVSTLTFANSYVEVWGDGVDYNANTDVTEVACSFAKGESGIIIVLTADITSQGYTANKNYICVLNGTLTLS